MKRLLTALFIIMLLLSGCTATHVAKSEPVYVSRFEIVESTPKWLIVADKKTNVMYAVSRGGYNVGTFTLLVDADGEPLLLKKR